MKEASIVDMSNWQPDCTYDEGLVLCEKLGLTEMMWHGDNDYGRLTQTGVNVLYTLMQMAAFAANPNNVLKES